MMKEYIKCVIINDTKYLVTEDKNKKSSMVKIGDTKFKPITKKEMRGKRTLTGNELSSVIVEHNEIVMKKLSPYLRYGSKRLLTEAADIAEITDSLCYKLNETKQDNAKNVNKFKKQFKKITSDLEKITTKMWYPATKIGD